MLSLAAIVYLGFLYDSSLIVIISASIIGGVFGFLRFNSHPARVFMGDGGSQFLGFGLAFLVLVLTQQANEVLSPALPLLLLGLPIADILAVFVLRARGGMNLFKATRNHIHHRLLDLGFIHFEAVIIIYSIQILFVVCAITIPYGYDGVIISIYLSVCASIFLALTFAERKGWKVNGFHHDFENTVLKIPQKDILVNFLNKGLEAGVSLFIIAAAMMSNTVPFDIGVSSVILLTLLLVASFTGWTGEAVFRLIIFVTVGFTVYLLSTNPPAWLQDESHIVYIYFGLLTVFAFLSARLTANEKFHVTPLDYLVIMLTLIIGFIQDTGFESKNYVWIAIQIIILFYACELSIQNIKSRSNAITRAATIALTLIALRGLI